MHWLNSSTNWILKMWKYKVKKTLFIIFFLNHYLTILNLLNTPYETVVLNSASQVKPQEAKEGKIKSFTLVMLIPILRHCYENTWKLFVYSAGGQVASTWQKERKSSLELMCSQEVGGSGTGQEWGESGGEGQQSKCCEFPWHLMYFMVHFKYLLMGQFFSCDRFSLQGCWLLTPDLCLFQHIKNIQDICCLGEYTFYNVLKRSDLKVKCFTF